MHMEVYDTYKSRGLAGSQVQLMLYCDRRMPTSFVTKRRKQWHVT
jgi:hypothetical protein